MIHPTPERRPPAAHDAARRLALVENALRHALEELAALRVALDGVGVSTPPPVRVPQSVEWDGQHITARLANALHNAYLKTWPEVAVLSDSHIYRWNNVGRVTLGEARQAQERALAAPPRSAPERRLRDGCCPTHGIGLTQTSAWTESLVDYYCLEGCPRGDCGFTARFYKEGGREFHIAVRK